jgi:hypothetical protein
MRTDVGNETKAERELRWDLGRVQFLRRLCLGQLRPEDTRHSRDQDAIRRDLDRCEGLVKEAHAVRCQARALAEAVTGLLGDELALAQLPRKEVARVLRALDELDAALRDAKE